MLDVPKSVCARTYVYTTHNNLFRGCVYIIMVYACSFNYSIIRNPRGNKLSPYDPIVYWYQKGK